MDRRNFLNSLIGGVAAGAAVRTWPFRVFSFPPNIAHPTLSLEALNGMIDEWNEVPFKIGETITIRRPPLFIPIRIISRFEASCEWPDAMNLPLDDFEKRFTA